MPPDAPIERGEIMLDMICEDVNRQMNPNGDDCPECGGEGGTYDCIDGCCLDAEYGCPDCFEPCRECQIYESHRQAAIREEVVNLGDIDVGIAWLKLVGRWPHDIPRDQVREALEREREKLAAFKGVA